MLVLYCYSKVYTNIYLSIFNCVDSMNVSYIPIAKARGFTTHLDKAVFTHFFMHKNRSVFILIPIIPRIYICLYPFILRIIPHNETSHD